MSQTEDGRNDAAVSGILPWAGIGLALLHLCLVGASHLGSGRVTSRVTIVLIVVGVGAAAAQGSVASLARRGAMASLPAHALLTAMLGVFLANAALALGLTHATADSAMIALVIVAAGALLVNVRWFMTAVYLGWAAWLIGVIAAQSYPGWVGDALTVVVASGLAAALNTLRRHELHSLNETRGMADAAAVRDSLTGLANRRGLALLGTQMLEAARRQGDAVHCTFLDIDGFGRLNAELGDEVGDEILVAVGDALRSVTRGTDVVARWSDDEFAIVGPGPGMAPLELERRVRERLASEEIVDPRRWDLGITAGGAMLAPWDGGALDTLLGRADQELNLRRTLRREATALPRRDPAA